MPFQRHYNPIICSARGSSKNIRFVLRSEHFVLRRANISFCGLYMQWTIFIQVG